MAELLDTMTVAASAERQKLQRHFGRFDILFFLICTIVGVDTIATVAEGGGESFTWLLVYAIVFFVPQALLFAELGTAFPQEGGPYMWTRLAFGHLAGAVNNLLYWVTNPVWMGGSLAISCIGAFQVFFNGGSPLPTPMTYVVSLVFVWLTIVAAITSFRVGKWPPTAGFARFLLLGLFSVSVILNFSARGPGPEPPGRLQADGERLRAPDRRPAVQLRRVRAAEQRRRGEIKPQRDVPFAIARSAVGSVLLYALPVIGILSRCRRRRSATSAGSSAPSRTCSRSTPGTFPPAEPRR